jgi:hypothetical protein
MSFLHLVQACKLQGRGGGEGDEAQHRGNRWMEERSVSAGCIGVRMVLQSGLLDTCKLISANSAVLRNAMLKAGASPAVDQ